MGRKILLLLGVLALTVASHLHIGYDCTVAGTEVTAGYSPLAEKTALKTAESAAEEILAGSASLPRVQRRLRLTLRRPESTTAELTDRILKNTPGVTVSDGVYVDGLRLGSVRDGESFSAALRRYIVNTTPSWAVSGMVSRELRVQPEYCRAGHEVTEADMVLLVTGAAPVFYYDLSGNMATA